MSQMKVIGILISIAGIIVLGLLSFAGITQGLTSESLLRAIGYGLIGIFLALSGIGLWQFKRWSIFFYAFFFITRSILRFPDLLTGNTFEIFRYILWSLGWLLLGWYLWKQLSSGNKTAQSSA